MMAVFCKFSISSSFSFYYKLRHYTGRIQETASLAGFVVLRKSAEGLSIDLIRAGIISSLLPDWLLRFFAIPVLSFLGGSIGRR
jgi:hypothetical protein